FQHHVQVAHRTEPAAELAEDLVERFASALRKDRLHEVQHRLEPAGSDPRLVDGVGLPLLQRLGDELAEAVDQFVGVDQKCETRFRGLGSLRDLRHPGNCTIPHSRRNRWPQNLIFVILTAGKLAARSEHSSNSGGRDTYLRTTALDCCSIPGNTGKSKTRHW